MCCSDFLSATSMNNLVLLLSMAVARSCRRLMFNSLIRVSIAVFDRQPALTNAFITKFACARLARFLSLGKGMLATNDSVGLVLLLLFIAGAADDCSGDAEDDDDDDDDGCDVSRYYWIIFTLHILIVAAAGPPLAYSVTSNRAKQGY